MSLKGPSRTIVVEPLDARLPVEPPAPDAPTPTDAALRPSPRVIERAQSDAYPPRLAPAAPP